MATTKKSSDLDAEQLAMLAGAGAVGGIVAKSATAPLERIKMLLQVQAMAIRADATTEPKYRGIVGTFRVLWREEGFFGMLKGNGANVRPDHAAHTYAYIHACTIESISFLLRCSVIVLHQPMRYASL